MRSKCWLWEGSKFSKGYGRFKLKGKTYRAHRIAYKAFLGPIPEGKLVLHTCDTPACVNPSHLFLGTHMDNHLDKISKGRARFIGRPNTGVWTKEYRLKKGREYQAKARAKRRALA